MSETPFSPELRDAPFPMPSSVPDGLHLELSRAQIKPGKEAEAHEWMAELNRREAECVATLGRERTPFQAAFFHRESDGSLWLYYLTLIGNEAPEFDAEASDIDKTHADYGLRVKIPGWEELQPMLMLTPKHIRRQFERFGRHGR